MAEKKKILYIVEAMGGGVFTYIVDLANELVNKYDMYIAYTFILASDREKIPGLPKHNFNREDQHRSRAAAEIPGNEKAASSADRGKSMGSDSDVSKSAF